MGDITHQITLPRSQVGRFPASQWYSLVMICFYSEEDSYGISPWHLVKRLDWPCSSAHSTPIAKGYMVDVLSRISTTKQSPGSAPSTAMGPERLWILVRSTFFTSSLAGVSRSVLSNQDIELSRSQSLLPIWAPVQSGQIASTKVVSAMFISRNPYQHTQS